MCFAKLLKIALGFDVPLNRVHLFAQIVLEFLRFQVVVHNTSTLALKTDTILYVHIVGKDLVPVTTSASSHNILHERQFVVMKICDLASGF